MGVVLLDAPGAIPYTHRYMASPEKRPKETVFRLANVEVEQSQTDEKILGVFRFESSGPNKRGPILLVFAEINGTGYVYDQLIDVINTEAEQSRTLTVGVDADPVTRFEKIIQNVNQAVARFVHEEPSPINWTRVNIFIVELSSGHLCLSGVGRLMNMFLQKQDEGAYKTFDLFGSLDQPPDVNPDKLFASIICGDMHAGDVLIAGSQNLERLRNELRMKERLATLPPVTAALELKQELEQQAIPDDFVATVIGCASADALPDAPLKKPEPLAGTKSTASIQKLRETETSTLRRLVPLFGGRADDTEKGEPVAPFVDGARGLLTRVMRVFHRAKASDVAAMASLRGMHAGFGSLFGKKRKALLSSIAVVIVAVVIVGSLVRFQQKAAAERAAWNATYDQAKALVEQAEGEAVYSEDRARRSLTEADEMADRLANTSKDQQAALAELERQIQEQRVKLRRIVDVSQPTELYALADGLAAGTMTPPIFFKESLVVADKSSNALIVVNVETKAAERVTLDIESPIAAIAPGNSSIIVALEDGSLLAAGVNGSVTPLSLGDDDAQAFTDLTLYASRLYRLDAASGQVWRYPATSGGFGSEQAYLQAASTNMNDAVALGIDANVYVLKQNGTVVRFFNGGDDGFTLPAIDPPLTNGNDLWTEDEAESQYLGIADAAGKRVLLFTKAGRLAAQYTSAAFTGPTGLVGDEAAKTLYVVDGNTLYQLALP